MGRATVGALLAVAFSLATGCGEDDRPANWTYIHASIVIPSCATSSCHTEFNAQAGLRLADRENAYNVLVGQTCFEDMAENTPGANFVVPFEPEASRLMHLLRGDDVRRAMPPDRPLPDADIDLFGRWILAGALCD